MTLTAVIVDDEPLARQRVRDLLEAESDIDVAGEAEDGVAALAGIRALKPDLVFLDVQMAGMDGFEVLAELDPASRPMIVFTTAYDAYAVRAFDENALDYLLKPLDPERFAEALGRARTALAGGREEWMRKLDALLRKIEKPSSLLRRIAVREDERVLFIETREVAWFEAAGNYVRLHLDDTRTHLVRMTMQILETRLDTRSFVRVHRGTIVNVARIAELQIVARGQYDVVLRNGVRLPMQRAYHDRLRGALADF